MTDDYDVIVIGAGFAGVTAAREFAARGHRTLLLEGRDRIGGRTRTGHFSDGTPVDLGGTYLSRIEPHLMAELERYELTDKLKPATVPPTHNVSFRDGESVWTELGDDPSSMAPITEILFADALAVFPDPTDPLANRAAVEAVDGMSLQDRIDELDLTPEQREEAAGFAVMAGLPVEQASYAGLLRWFALGGGTNATFDDFTIGSKLSTATGGLLDAILADGGTELRLGTAVRDIVAADDSVTVTTDDGQSFTAKAVVVATPANVWPELNFTPALPDAQLALAEEGVAGVKSAKAMAILTGEDRPISFDGDAGAPVGGFTDKFRAPGEQVITVYPDVTAFEGEPTVELVQGWLERMFPHAEVSDVLVSTYYDTDPFTRGSWGFLGIGQLTKYEPHTFTKLGDRIAFAGADISKHFHGWIDGAIETGLRAAADLLPVVEPRR